MIDPFEIAIVAGPSPLEQFQLSEDRALEVSSGTIASLNPATERCWFFASTMSCRWKRLRAVTKALLSTSEIWLYRGLAALKPEMEQLRFICSKDLAEARAMNQCARSFVCRDLDGVERAHKLIGI